MENLPSDICLKIFCFLDHKNLAAAQLDDLQSSQILTCEPLEIGKMMLKNYGLMVQVCRKWRDIGSDNTLWSNHFNERWGFDQSAFYAPVGSNSWKDVYIIQDRCDRVGLGLKIIREGYDYFLVHQGQIQRHLGSRLPESQTFNSHNNENGNSNESVDEQIEGTSIFDKILFFIGDMEAATVHAKRSRLL